ncbi:hypothetical protein [Desulfofundulus thermocisternus]|uniref:hypothetical protein n=1 Tax=Desulfofundulus thermocisternus TaxID=42471 RepID=UPI00217D789B|nr:hypothetical protein [Desulfofundulus thermocisternus]
MPETKKVGELMLPLGEYPEVYDSDTELFTMSWAFFYRKDPLNELTVTKVGQAIRPLVDACVQAGDTVVRAIELRMNVNCCPFLREEKLWGLSGP